MTNLMNETSLDLSIFSNALIALRAQLYLDPRITEPQLARFSGDIDQIAEHICIALNSSLERLQTDQVLTSPDKVDSYICELTIKPRLRARLQTLFRRITRQVRNLHVSPQAIAIMAEWNPLLPKMWGKLGCTAIARYAVTRGISFGAFSDQTLHSWGLDAENRHRTKAYIRNAKSAFLHLIEAHEMTHAFPLLTVEGRNAPRFRLRLDKMPDHIRVEINRILIRMREDAGQFRPGELESSLRGVIRRFEEFIGFIVTILGIDDIKTLDQCFVEEFVRKYVEFLRDVKHCIRESIAGKISRLRNVMQRYSVPRDRDFSRMDLPVEDIPEDDPDELLERQRSRQTSYEAFAAIPQQITAKRGLASNRSAKRQAQLFHDELLTSWIATFPWYPEMIRTCRIKEPFRNVFYGPIKRSGPMMRIAPWAAEIVDNDPDASFWQFVFFDWQIRWERESPGLIVRRLIPLLEEYLVDHRPNLVSDDEDPGTLFLSRTGKMMDCGQLSQLIGDLSYRFTGVRVRPSSTRPMFVYHWLEHYKEDYENLSSILGAEIPSVKAEFGPKTPSSWPN